MAQKMTKRGNLDNEITYEFVCDTTADLQAIDPQYITMGSVATVIQGESGFEVYMANSNREWLSLGSGGTSDESSSSSGSTSPVPTATRAAVPEKEINFIDYEGTILYSYSVPEFLELSEMPANPTHEGLIAQGWNWTLADAQAYARKYPKMWIGQLYITDDGKTRLYIEINNSDEISFSFYNEYWNGFENTAIIDWGDGSEPEIATTGSAAHIYSNTGKYIITIELTKTTNFSSTKPEAITDVRYGRNIGEIYLPDAYLLKTITIPEGIKFSDDSCFSECCNLSSIIIPNSVTSIYDQCFYYCYSIKTVSLPNTITYIGEYSFYGCHSLQNIHLSESVKSIENSAFSDNYSLALYIPDNEIIIDSDGVYGVTKIYMFSSVPPQIEPYLSSCIIYVPYSSDHSILNAYKSATNWANEANIMYEWEVPSYD